MSAKFTGLTAAEVKKMKSLGLSNEIIDSYTPTTFEIYRRNIFSLINIVLIPLLVTQAYYQLYKDVFAFGIFALINTVISIYDELRVKKQLDKLKSQFQQTACVIRDGQEVTIPASEIVEGDLIKAHEGEGVIADGKIVYENYLQIDESALNGESNYIRKEVNEKILSGSFIVTGDCIYQVESVGRHNYLNKLGAEALKYKEKKSQLQENGDKIILFLVFAAIILSLANFYFSGNQFSNPEKILSLTAIVSLIIPQTLIFLFTLTFTISITKLYNKGVLVQKGGSIEELSNINVICLDKTGTITTNEMKLIDVKYFNAKDKDFGEFYNAVKDKLVGVNKTQQLLNKLYEKVHSSQSTVNSFDQIPFTSKNKFSLITGEFNNKEITLLFGAFSMLKDHIDKSLIEEVENYINVKESDGNRILIGLYFNKLTIDYRSLITNHLVVYTIEEQLNDGIENIIKDLQNQGIAVKIISGDSLRSVQRVLQKVGISTDKIIDLSEKHHQSISTLVTKYEIFTRAKPEDKLEIIKALKVHGNKVAMVGDGINDVLSIKAADVSIAMESGAKIARDVADIVLLNNDYKKVPMIFFEGENIIFNLKLSTKLFLVKSFTAILLTSFFTFVLKSILPIHPASALIFSFLGSSAPSYILVFTRQKVEDHISFFKEVLTSTIPTSIIFGIVTIYTYFNLKSQGLSFTAINTSLIIILLAISIIYSLFLVWESKKMRNFLALIASFVILMLIGIFQTILPIYNLTISVHKGINITPNMSDNDTLLILIILLIGAIILYYLLIKTFRIKKTLRKVLVAIISLSYIPIVSVFPFTYYYSVESVPFDIYKFIAIITVVTTLLVFIVNLVGRYLIRPKIK